MSSDKNSPYFTGVASLLDTLIAILNFSDPLPFAKEAKEHWLSGQEEETVKALIQARKSYVWARKKFDSWYSTKDPERWSDRGYLFMSELIALIGDTNKSTAEKNRTIMQVWFDSIKPSYMGRQLPRATRAIGAFLFNLFFIPLGVGMTYYELNTIWHNNVGIFWGVLCIVCVVFFLIYSRRGFFALLITSTIWAIATVFGIFEINEIMLVPQNIFDFFFHSAFALVAIFPLAYIPVAVQMHFLPVPFGKLSCVWIRPVREGDKRVWEFVFVDTHGKIREVIYRSRLRTIFTSLAFPPAVLTKERGNALEKKGAWQILPLFLSTPSKRMPKTSGFVWWLKSHGLWLITPETISTPVLWEDVIKAGVTFTDEEIAEFLSRLPSPLHSPPGYEEFVASTQ